MPHSVLAHAWSQPAKEHGFKSATDVSTSAHQCQGHAERAYYYFLLKPYPLLATGLLSHMYSMSLKKDGNTTSIKGNELNYAKGKRMGLAFIGSQLCLRDITIKINSALQETS